LRRGPRRLIRGVIRQQKHLVEDGESLVELLASDRQRRSDDDDIPMGHQVEALVHRGLRELCDRSEGLARSVEGNERFPGLAIADELDAPEEALASHLADRWVPLL